jgi:hypothetical protein
MLYDILNEGRIEFSQRNPHGHRARISELAISFNRESCQRFLWHHSVDCEGRKRQCLGVLEIHVFPSHFPDRPQAHLWQIPLLGGCCQVHVPRREQSFRWQGSGPAFPAVWCDFNSDLSERLTRVYARSVSVKPRNSHTARCLFLAPFPSLGNASDTGCYFLDYDTVYSGTSVPVFRGNVMVTRSELKPRYVSSRSRKPEERNLHFLRPTTATFSGTGRLNKRSRTVPPSRVKPKP